MATGQAEILAECGIVEQTGESTGESVDITGCDQQAGFTINDDFRDAAGSASNHRSSPRHGFDVDEAERFVAGWADENCAGAVVCSEHSRVDATEKGHAIGLQAGIFAAEFVLPVVLGIRAGQDRSRVREAGQDRGQGSEQRINAFAMFESSDVEERGWSIRRSGVKCRGGRQGKAVRNERNPLGRDSPSATENVPMVAGMGEDDIAPADEATR